MQHSEVIKANGCFKTLLIILQKKRLAANDLHTDMVVTSVTDSLEAGVILESLSSLQNRNCQTP